MKKILYILLFLTNIFCKAQNIRKCVVYQFSGNDSSKKHIALKQTFNHRGKLVSETYSNYKETSSSGISDGTYYYYYDDTLLIKCLFVSYTLDTSITVYYYNELKQLVKNEYFNCEKRLKKDVKKGLGQSGGCVVFEEDYEKDRTWLKSNEVIYGYDNRGRKIKKVDEHNYDLVWKYDSLNRIIQEKGFSSDKLEYVQNYEYFNGGYRYSCLLMDENGMPKLPEYSDIIFNPIFTSTFYLDSNGRIIKEETSTEKGIIISDLTHYYDSDGRIIKTIYRDLDEHYIDKNIDPKITHVYEYE